jgi:hypothetical protein
VDVVHGGGRPAVGRRMAGACGAGGFSENLLAYVSKKWGREAPPRLMVWQRLVRDNRAAGAAPARVEQVSLKQVNGFFNQVPYFNDIKHWGPGRLLGHTD